MSDQWRRCNRLLTLERSCNLLDEFQLKSERTSYAFQI